MNNFQTTIKSQVVLNGVGLHTGANVTITFKPSKINSGYIFKRVDLVDSPIIEADVQYVVDTQRGTNLEKNGVKIQTCEHVLSALVGFFKKSTEGNLNKFLLALSAFLELNGKFSCTGF